MARHHAHALIVSLALVGAPTLVVGCDDPVPKRPLGATCFETGQCTGSVCISGHCLDPDLDEDGDGLTNSVEGALGSNALNPDTDYDGVVDGDETAGAAARDTDGDGIPDILESATQDADSDCLPDELDPDDSQPAADLLVIRAKVCHTTGVCGDQLDAITVSCPDDSHVPACDYAAVNGYEADEVSCDGLDNDCDGLTDEGQPDADGDGVADCVDADDDGDGVDDDVDNCLGLANADQQDADGDDLGDACDPPAGVSVQGFEPASPAADTQPVVSGATEPFASVALYGDAACATPLGSGEADATGAFSVSLTVPADTTTALWAIATNRAGLSSTCAGTFASYTEDSTAPDAPTFVSGQPASPSADRLVTLEGHSEPLAAVALFEDDNCTASLGAAEADLDGDFAVAITLPADAATELRATATDQAGNTSACALFTAYIHDGTAPEAPTLDAASAARFAAPVGGPIATTLSGCAETSATVSLWGDPACELTAWGEGGAQGSGEGCGAGLGAFSVAISLVANGETPVYARVVDAAGNASECTPLGTIVHDDIAPQTPPAPVAEATAWSTSALTFRIRGVGEPGGTAALYLDEACNSASVGGLPIGAAGSFVTSLDVSNEAAMVRVRTYDEAGNASQCSPPRVLVGDTVVAVIGQGTGLPKAGIPVQLHAPDGSPLSLLYTGDDGRVTAPLFAGCGVTAALSVTHEGTRAMWRSVLSIAPGDIITLAAPEFSEVLSMSYIVNVALPSVPADTARVLYRAPCKTQSDSSPPFDDPQFIRLSSSCLSQGTFSMIAEAQDDNGTLLGYATLVDEPLPLPNSDPMTVTFGDWQSDFGSLDVDFESTAGARTLEVFPTLTLGLGVFTDRYGDRGLVTAVPGAPGSLQQRFGRLPGMSLGYELTTAHPAIDGLSVGLTSNVRRGLPLEVAVEVASPADFLPEVYDAQVVWTEDGRPEFQWVAEPGLGTEADALDLSLSAYGSSLSVRWTLSARPDESGALVLPTVSDEFPVSEAVQPGGSMYVEDAIWVDVLNVDGYDQAVGLDGAQLSAWFRQGDSGTARASSCCGYGTQPE